MLIAGIGAGLTFRECEGEKDTKREECENDIRKKSKKLDNAVEFIKLYFVITCIILCLCFSYNKKIIIINCICILVKLSLFIGYLINLILMDSDNDFIIISILLLIEISSDICFLVNEKIKFTIKN